MVYFKNLVDFCLFILDNQLEIFRLHLIHVVSKHFRSAIHGHVSCSFCLGKHIIIMTKNIVDKRPVGRPSTYNIKITEEICVRIANGESLKTICRDKHIPTIATFYNWLRANPELLNQYQQAKEDQIDSYAEEICEIADDATNDFVEKKLKSGEMVIQLDNEHVLRSRLRIDTRKWICERLRPKKYGATPGTNIEVKQYVQIYRPEEYSREAVASASRPAGRSL